MRNINKKIEKKINIIKVCFMTSAKYYFFFLERM